MIWTAKAVNEKLNDLTGGDAHVEQGYKEKRPQRKDFHSFAEYYRADTKIYGYICKDKYRPSSKFWGKYPIDAAKNAGFTIG
jgi:hypothetical protein